MLPVPFKESPNSGLSSTFWIVSWEIISPELQIYLVQDLHSSGYDRSLEQSLTLIRGFSLRMSMILTSLVHVHPHLSFRLVKQIRDNNDSDNFDIGSGTNKTDWKCT